MTFTLRNQDQCANSREVREARSYTHHWLGTCKWAGSINFNLNHTQNHSKHIKAKQNGAKLHHFIHVNNVCYKEEDDEERNKKEKRHKHTKQNFCGVEFCHIFRKPALTQTKRVVDQITDIDEVVFKEYGATATSRNQSLLYKSCLTHLPPTRFKWKLRSPPSIRSKMRYSVTLLWKAYLRFVTNLLFISASTLRSCSAVISCSNKTEIAKRDIGQWKSTAQPHPARPFLHVQPHPEGTRQTHVRVYMCGLHACSTSTAQKPKTQQAASRMVQRHCLGWTKHISLQKGFGEPNVLCAKGCCKCGQHLALLLEALLVQLLHGKHLARVSFATAIHLTCHVHNTCYPAVNIRPCHSRVPLIVWRYSRKVPGLQSHQMVHRTHSRKFSLITAMIIAEHVHGPLSGKGSIRMGSVIRIVLSVL